MQINTYDPDFYRKRELEERFDRWLIPFRDRLRESVDIEKLTVSTNGLAEPSGARVQITGRVRRDQAMQDLNEYRRTARAIDEIIERLQSRVPPDEGEGQQRKDPA